MQIEEIRIDPTSNLNTLRNGLIIKNKVHSRGDNTILLYHQYIYNSMSTKICSKCGKEKDIYDFPIRIDARDGHRSWCKVCESIRIKKYWALNSERLCHQKNEYRELYRDVIVAQNQKYREENREAIKRKKHADYLEKAEMVKDRVSKYRKTAAGKHSDAKYRHKRRAFQHNLPNTLTLEQWNKILANQNNKCAICGKRFCKLMPPTKDHIIPVSKGGGLTFENVQALCQSCNSKKHDTLDHSLIVSWGAIPS